jgi:hypothetical protein
MKTYLGDSTSGVTVQVSWQYKWDDSTSGLTVQVGWQYKWVDSTSGMTVQVGWQYKWDDSTALVHLRTSTSQFFCLVHVTL